MTGEQPIALRARRLTTGDRAIFAAALGSWGAFIAYFSMASHPQHVAKDFSFPWRAARWLPARQFRSDRQSRMAVAWVFNR